MFIERRERRGREGGRDQFLGTRGLEEKETGRQEREKRDREKKGRRERREGKRKREGERKGGRESREVGKAHLLPVKLSYLSTNKL